VPSTLSRRRPALPLCTNTRAQSLAPSDSVHISVALAAARTTMKRTLLLGVALHVVSAAATITGQQYCNDVGPSTWLRLSLRLSLRLPLPLPPRSAYTVRDADWTLTSTSA
jgi:hypothetical protein